MEFDFWEDSRGVSPVEEFIRQQNNPEDVTKRIDRLEKYFLKQLLRAEKVKSFGWVKKDYGFSLFELIPDDNRIFFVVLVGTEQAKLIHAFRKKGNKTPQREVCKALKIALILKQQYPLI
jgi:phage-related protein